MNRFLFLSILIAIPARAQSRAPLDSLVKLALKQNPQLHSLRHRADAAYARVGLVSTLEAPQIGIEFYEIHLASFPLPFRHNMETDYFVQQMFPWPGKLSSMGKAAQLSADMQHEEAAAFARQLTRNLKSAYFDLYFIQRQIDVNDQTQRLLRQILETATKRYEVGLGSQSDILRIKTEQSKAAGARLELEKQEAAMEAMIGTLVGGDTDTLLNRLPDPGVVKQEWEYEQLVAVALERRAELKSMQFNKDMFAAEVDAARREYYPDIMVRGTYKSMAQGGDAWALMIGANIPLAFWSKEKYRSRVREMQSHVHHAEMEMRNMRNMVIASVKSAITSFQKSRQQLKLYRDELLPQAQQTLDITLSDYQTGRTSFSALLENYKMLLMTRLDFEMMVLNALKSEADLEQAIGVDLQSLGDSKE